MKYFTNRHEYYTRKHLFFNKNSYLSIFPLVNFFLLSGRLYEEKCLCRHLQQSSLFSTQILNINSLTYRNLGVNVTLNQAIIKTILVTYEIKSRCILYHFIWNELLWYLRHMVKIYYALWKKNLRALKWGPSQRTLIFTYECTSFNFHLWVYINMLKLFV